MQRVVNLVCIESDYCYEWVSRGEVDWVERLRDFMDFLTEAAKKGFNVNNGIYEYADKLNAIKQ